MSNPLVFHHQSSGLRTLLFIVLYLYYTISYFATANDLTFTNEIAVHIEGGENLAHSVAKRHGFINKGQIGSLQDHYLFVHPRIAKRSTSHSEEHHARLRGEPSVIWFEQQAVKSRKKRDLVDINDQIDPLRTVTDPKWNSMWYLKRKNGFVPNMNVVPAWNAGYSGKGVVVTILDDGIESNHSDLIANYDPQASFDVNSNDSNPFPRYDFTNENKHGTRCAGEVAAMNNRICGIGIAYNAKIGGIRMLDGPVTDRVEAASIGHNPQHIDIYSASWGPDDDGKTVDGPGTLTKKVFLHGIHQGRGGLGSIFIWASGNGGRHSDSCNCDGYTNSMFTLSVSSTTEHLTKPWYLEECSSTLATTYSSGSFSDSQIITTDLHNLCTDRHTGTSASAPMAAAIVALVLEANPRLTWRDVQYITMRNARPFSDGNWVTNGRGRKVSLRYGYGLMDTSAMVRDAEHWVNVPNATNCTVTSPTTNAHFSTKYEETINTSPMCDVSNRIRYLEHVQARISLTYHRRGDLRILLTSPAGTESVLLITRRSDTKEDFKDWPFMSVQFWGEDPAGKWRLKIVSVASGSTHYGTLKSWSLVMYGTQTDPEAVQRYINGHLATTPIPTQTCHEECDSTGCEGPLPRQCHACRHYQFNRTRECVAHCPATAFSDPVSRTCAECELGSYKDASGCQTCSTDCRSCHKSSTICTSCPEGKVLTGGTCVPSKQCRDHEYVTDTGRCESCHIMCANCTGPGVNECTTCRPSLYLRGGTCMSYCRDGMYHANNKTPHPSSHPHPALLHPNPDCRRCHPSCHSCSGPSEKDCTMCVGMTELRDGVCVAISGPCSVGEYRDAEYVCRNCATLCASCSGPLKTQCITCLSSMKFQNGECQGSCSRGFYEATRPVSRAAGTKMQVCIPCHHTCDSCDGPEENQCRSCIYGAKKVGRLCVMTCAEGSYMPVGGGCASCHTSCKACVRGSSSDCTQCHSGSYLLKGSCLKQCPRGFFGSLSHCNHCPAGCSACGGVDHCTSCMEGFTLVGSLCQTPSSHKVCPPKHYVDPQTKMCMPCHASCAMCSGPLDSDCKSCEFPHTYHSLSNTCRRCCHDNSDSHWCCSCDKSLSCRENVALVERPHKSGSGVAIFTVAIVAGAFLVAVLVTFTILQLRSHHRLCWAYPYSKLPNESSHEMADTVKLMTYCDSDGNDDPESHDVVTNGYVNGHAHERT